MMIDTRAKTELSRVLIADRPEIALGNFTQSHFLFIVAEMTALPLISRFKLPVPARVLSCSQPYGGDLGPFPFGQRLNSGESCGFKKVHTKPSPAALQPSGRDEPLLWETAGWGAHMASPKDALAARSSETLSKSAAAWVE